jgi:hypothetical protein
MEPIVLKIKVPPDQSPGGAAGGSSPPEKSLSGRLFNIYRDFAGDFKNDI